MTRHTGANKKGRNPWAPSSMISVMSWYKYASETHAVLICHSLAFHRHGRSDVVLSHSPFAVGLLAHDKLYINAVLHVIPCEIRLGVAFSVDIHLINIYTSDEAPQTSNEATHREHKIHIFRNKTAPGFQRFYALFITYVISALNNMQKRTFFRIICIFLPSANRETAVCNQVYFNTKRRRRFPQAHNSGTLKDYCIYIVFRITDYQTRQRIMKQNRKR